MLISGFKKIVIRIILQVHYIGNTYKTTVIETNNEILRKHSCYAESYL